jgi:hypothetical protein
MLDAILMHLRVTHEIDSIELYEEQVREMEKQRESRGEFALFVGMLKEQKTKGLITAEEYRERVVNWLEERRRSDAN